MPYGKPDGDRETPRAAPRRGGSTWVSLLVVLGGLIAILACGGLVGLLKDWAGGILPLLAWVGGCVFLLFVWFRLTAKKTRLALRRALGLSPGVKELARRRGVPEAELRALRPSYREIRVRKRCGGTRLLHAPDPPTKAMQRRILRRLLARMDSHPAAYGFEEGRSIAHNAAQHVGRAIVLRFDVVDFFPSTRAERIERMFLRFGWDAEAAALLVRLVTHQGGLPQGAPTSPRLSNLVNRGLDADLERWIGRRRGRCTRYADDVTVSFPEDWRGEPERTRAAVARAFSLRGYRLHGKEKSSVRRRHQRQLVTGLVVNGKVGIPRETRRLLRAARHRVATGRPATLTEEQLRGWAAFENMVALHGAETPEPWVRTRRPGNRARWRP